MNKLSTRLILIALAILHNNPSNAYFRLGSVDGSDIGDFCYSECMEENLCPKLYVCYCLTPDYCGNKFANMKKCSNDYRYGEEPCLADKIGNDTAFYGYFCDIDDDDACNKCDLPTYPSEDWEISDSTKHVVTRDTRVYIMDDADEFYDCNYDTGDIEFGCEAGYYTTASSPSSTMTCIKCPDKGLSDEGNRKITGCYIPSGNTFTDSTGSGAITGGKCYYQN